MPSPNPSGEGLWTAFVSAKSRNRLAYSKEQDEIVVQNISAAIPEHFVEIPTLTQDDNRSIAEAFAATCPAEDKEKLLSASKHPNFWAEWFAQIGAVQDGLYKPRWAEFRRARVEELLWQRLEAAGAPANSRPKYAKALQESRCQKKKAPLPRPVDVVNRGVPQINSVRALALQAIEQMAEEDLRKIWLPLGAMFDVFAKRH